MFWAITCESGKRYSQIPEEPFHVSSAALEPRDKIPENKQVSLMIEHRGKEFLLCTLEYDRVMQVSLDLNFSKGEETFFFVSGEGTIHLSGYLDVEDKEQNELNAVSDAYRYGVVADEDEKMDDDEVDEDDDEEDEDEEEDEDDDNAEEDENEELGTKRLLTLDDSEEEDSEDWQPEMEYANSIQGQNRRISEHYLEDNVNLDEEEEQEDEESSGAEEKSEEESGKINQLTVPSSSFKRPRSKISPKRSGFEGIVNSSNKKRKKMKTGKEVLITGQKGESLATQISSSDSESEELNSSIGRTPMPPKKPGFIRTPRPNFSPNANLKHTAKTKKEPVNKSEETVQFEQKYSKKLPSGIEIEDIRIGNGPVAKRGKFAHVYYIGKFANNKIFESVKPGNKPISFRLGKEEVMKGWDYGIEGMRVGGKRLLKIPPEMAYGKKGRGKIPPNSTLLFTIELQAVS